MIDLKDRVSTFFYDKLGFCAKDISTLPSSYTYPVYRFIIDDDDYAMGKVVDFTENTCKFAMHSKAAIHETKDFTYEWQLFNVEETNDPKERALVSASYLDFCSILLDEKSKDFIEYLPSLHEIKSSLQDLTELCEHIWTLEDKFADDRISLIKNNKDEVNFETDIRSMSIRFCNIISQAIKNASDTNSSLITDQEKQEIIESLQELKDRTEFKGNHLLYKMDTALGYIGKKEQ